MNRSQLPWMAGINGPEVSVDACQCEHALHEIVELARVENYGKYIR